MEESDGEWVTGSDTVEVTEERAIRSMPIVTTLSFVRVVKDKERGVRVTLTCYNMANVLKILLEKPPLILKYLQRLSQQSGGGCVRTHAPRVDAGR